MIPETIIDAGKELYNLYARVPSIEVWTNSTVYSTIKQIEFYWGSGMFQKQVEALEVCQSLKDLIEMVEKQAEIGKKYATESKKHENPENYKLYSSEIEITTNCVHVGFDAGQAVYLGHLSYNTMKTHNTSYCTTTRDWFNNLIKKSNLISGISEKTRYQFFRLMYKSIDNLIARIEED